MKAKTVEETKVIYGNLMLPEHANIIGNVHGGEIMKMMDNAGGVVARRHSRSNVVTARVDSLEFRHPIHVGNYVSCICEMTHVGTSSMEVMITVTVEDLTHETGPKVALTGYFTYVAIDNNGKPVPVPPLKLITDEEKERFNEGRERYLKYKESK
ncbi:MAG TPA: acyl-CoA thioesterase [Tissierellia bacterium]|jgi:acyl-CoA hydrolase|nr:acyl-CoA thioesterase [Tissierellia bacterium]